MMALILISLLSSTTHAEILFDERLVPFVKHFKEYSKEYWPISEPSLPDSAYDGLIIRIEGVSNPGWDGVCTGIHDDKPHGKRFITLDNELWLKYSDESRETMLFHELGHCVLGLEHNDKQCGDRRCSLMHSSGVRDSEYEAHKQEYLQELFFKGALKRRSQ